MIAISTEIKFKAMQNKMRQLLKAIESKEWLDEYAKAAKLQIIARTKQGRGIDSRAKTEAGIERAKVKKLWPLDADTIRQRKKAGYGRGKASKLRMTGKMLGAIQIRQVGPSLGERGLNFFGIRTPGPRPVALGYFGGKAAETAYHTETGRPYMSRRRHVFLSLKEKRKLNRNIIRPYFARKLRGL